MGKIDKDALDIYREESLENLSTIETSLLTIENNEDGDNTELVNEVFRSAHSIKGGGGFLGLVKICELSHIIEDILGLMRNDKITVNCEIINVLLAGFDKLRDMIEIGEESNDEDVSELISSLKPFTTLDSDNSVEITEIKEEIKLENKKIKTPLSTEDNTYQFFLPSGEVIFDIEKEIIDSEINKTNFIYLLKFNIKKEIIPYGSLNEFKDEMKKTGSILGEFTVEPDIFFLYSTVIPTDMIDELFKIDINNIHFQHQFYNTSKDETEIIEDNSENIQETEEIKEEEVNIIKTQEKTKINSPFVNASNLRVNVKLLDNLMNLAGELVLSRNQLLQNEASGDMDALRKVSQRIDLVTSELQETIMSTRMQPIKVLFDKFPRVVRDLSKELNKEINLHLDGQNVELDKTLIEGLSEPLVHLIRNAVDHGIETTAKRKKAGKNPAGNISLKAYHEAGLINIQIIDDGAGIDVNKIGAKAISKGLLSEEKFSSMTDKEKFALIFLPSFSTAEKVTDISGRGVGMDVVKTNLDKMGGVIDIDSVMGKGTTLHLKLPLTLSIISGLLVAAGNERFAIPQVNVKELLRIPAKDINKRIEKVGDAEVVRLRDALLPLLKLSDVLNINKTFISPETNEELIDNRKNVSSRRTETVPVSAADKRKADSDRRKNSQNAISIVVINTGSFRYGLVVDELFDSEEIVVKPLGRLITGCREYSGATILGDGYVALILDVANIASIAKITSITDSKNDMDLQEKIEISKHTDNISLLLFNASPGEQFAVPINLVQRIDTIKFSDIQNISGTKVIQYGETTIPVFYINEVMKELEPLPETAPLLTLIFKVGNRNIGFIVSHPIDAIDLENKIDQNTFIKEGIMGSVIINNKPVLLIDVDEFASILKPEWFVERIEKKSMILEEKVAANEVILLAEDSDFFRTQIKKYIESEGFKVIEAEDGLIAWNKLSQHSDEIKLLVTDIEMPNMDGFELTEKIRKSKEYSDLPIIAVTSLASEDDVTKGTKCGIDDYQIKLNKENLMKSIRDFFRE